MAFNKLKGREIYRSILKRLYLGEPIIRARENLEISISGVIRFCDKLSSDGYIFITNCGNRQKRANFTFKGLELLKEFDINPNVTQSL